MKIGTFDPIERAKEKQRSRDEDQRRLDSGEITREQLWKENSFFDSLDIANSKITAIGSRRIRRNGINKTG